ncbi:T9SS type A sorting domain-containing protein [Saccharicrinis sp. GN24d3]|uniref:T9SS type A sorting domain-containing protein n=1 Tax=Saccharicrinis sp. GN24d3 TaxID=3458416 RepID=UPI0040350ECF
MKKIYLMIAFALICVTSFAQVIEAEGKPQSGNYVWGLSAAAGSSITVTGSGFAVGDIVDGNLTLWSGWSKGSTIYGTGSMTADADGNISGTIDIDANTPVGPAMTGGNGYMIQLHRNEGIEGEDNLFASGVTFVNLVVEITTATDINSPAIAGSIYVSGNTLYIKDATENAYAVYNLSGTVVQAGLIQGTSAQIPLALNKGIYIVKVGNTATKIAL